jgi:general secretion pathway protein D
MPSRPVFLPFQHMPKSRLARNIFAAVCLAFFLVGCAGQMAFREGKGLIAQDKIEAGLSKFQEAMDLEPRNVEFRAAYLQTRERAVTSFLDRATRLGASGNRDDAEALYQRVLKIDPANERAREGQHALNINERHEQLLKDAGSALENKDIESTKLKLSTILTENPNNEQAKNLQRAMNDKVARPVIDSTLSSAYRKPISIDFKDVALKQIFEVISHSSGLNFLFDKDVKTDQKTSIFLKNSTIEAAVHFTLLTNQLEQQVLDANTILIYPNTQAKQKDYQEMVIKSFFLANADAKAVANTLKTILKSRDVIVDEKLNMIIVRDTPDAMKLAEKLVALHDVPEPEVMLEVEILEVKKSRLQDLGITWPSTLALTPLSSTTGGALTLRDLRTNINGSTIGAGIGPVTVNAMKEDDDARILANPRIRARNHEKAKILIGDRVPNITTTATSTGFISESVNYIDVGLKLDVEPTIYLDNDVAIKVALEVSNIVSQLQTKSGSVAYQIGTRNASTVLRLKDGENQVLAGLIDDEDRRSASKVPGFGDIPILGRLFGSTNDNNQKTEIVLSITPHLVRNIQRPDATQSEFRAGTDSSFHVRSDSLSATPTASSSSLPTNVETPATQPHATPPVNNNAYGGNNNLMQNGLNGLPIDNGLGSGVVGSPALPTTGAQLQWQGPAQVKVGDTFALQLTMVTDQPITSLPMTIGFDNVVLQVVGITEGDFLKQDNAQTSFSSRVDPNGQILITSVRTGETGATSPGTIATINFRALAPTAAGHVQLLTAAPVGLLGRAVSAPLPAPYSVQAQP